MRGLLKDKVSIFVLIFIIVCFICLTISVVNIMKWNIDKNKTQDNIDKIKEDAIITQVVDDKKTEVIESSDESNPYFDYINMNMIDVNFQELKNINNEVKGWIQVNGTNVNYPFVQHEDNKFYLTHSIDKSYNSAGWLFLDYRNNIDNMDKNTIIYAHGRLDETMFGSLKNVLNDSWLSNTDNYFIKLATENENSLWQIFSVYHIPTTNDYIKTTFNNDNEWRQFIKTITDRSFFNFNTSITNDDKILTLSTCYNDREKMVVHAKLIKKRTK